MTTQTSHATAPLSSTASTAVSPASSPLSECIKLLLEQEQATITSIGQKLHELFTQAKESQKTALLEIYALLLPIYNAAVSALDAYEMDLSRLLEAEKGNWQFLTEEQRFLLQHIPEAKRVSQVRLLAFSRSIERPSVAFSSALQQQIRALFASMQKLGWSPGISPQAFDQTVQRIGQFLCFLDMRASQPSSSPPSSGMDWGTLLWGVGAGVALGGLAPGVLSEVSSWVGGASA